MIIFLIKKRVGRNANSLVDIVLFGTQILNEHCILENKSNEYVELRPCSGALCYVNGKKIESSVSLKSSDRVIFGNSHVFRYNNPEQARKEIKLASQTFTDSADWVSATQELKEKQGIDIKHEMDRLLALDEQYKKELETNKMYKEQITEYTSKINELEKKVDIMTKSMMSSSCISSLTNTTNFMNESNLSLATLNDDELVHSQSTGNFMSEREYRLALWVARRWRYHQMTSLRVGSFFLFVI